jgi:hypothetical protein
MCNSPQGDKKSVEQKKSAEFSLEQKMHHLYLLYSCVRCSEEHKDDYEAVLHGLEQMVTSYENRISMMESQLSMINSTLAMRGEL